MDIIGSPKAANNYPRIDGFTFVELLIIIAIASILAALLLPTLTKSLASVRALTCQNNLRQIGVGVSIYAGDNNDFIVPFAGVNYRDAGGNNNFGVAYYCAAGYLQRSDTDAKSVILCPDNYEVAAANGAANEAKFRGTYGVTAMLSYYYYPGTAYYSGTAGMVCKRLGRLEEPSRHFYVSEKISCSNSSGNSLGFSRNEPELYPLAAATGGFSYIHADSANFWFYDGHSERLPKYRVPAQPPFNTPSPAIFPW